MGELVFVGSEAEGYYSGSQACEGVFISKEYYDKYEEILKNVFSDRSHGELDGKHSEVYGDLIVVELNGVADALKLINEKDADYETYHFMDYLDDYDDDEFTGLGEHLDEVYAKVDAIDGEYDPYVFILTKEEQTEVKAFVERLQKEGR